ncbi:MAG: DNA mismatch repair endonuclease MutL [Verrucomicrobiota bacterium]
MSKIRILPDALASQVAAGEVVERPAAVIRELVENSLDAGSTHITVEVQRGGTAMIRVVDDGCGMNREDALLSIERHATSKIRTKEDLAAILTFGFRGEALPSIASVTRFRIATREKEALSGTEVEINGGKLSAVKDYGGAAGTLIEARSLFFNVPARRKFLRTEATEYSHIEQQFVVHAMAHPEVTFTLIRDGAVAFHLPSTQDALERIRGLIGDQLSSRLIKVEPTEHRDIRVWGYIGGPGLSRSNRQQQITFLNGRPIESSSINYGLREGFHTSLMKGQHPVTVLFIEMNAEGYDINVHPAKREVRFHDGFAVRDALAKAVSRALETASKLPQGHVPPSQMERPALPQIAVPQQQSFALHTPSALFLKSETPISMPVSRPAPLPARPAMPMSESVQATGSSHVESARSAPVLEKAPGQKSAHEPDLESEAEPDSKPATEPAREIEMPRFRILGVVHRLYIMLESDEGLVLMDQHAAHERVNFEKMRRAMEQGGVPSQRLLMPLTLQVTPRDADILRRHQETLGRLGIEVEPFGPNIFKVEALPTFLKTDDPVTWLDQVIEELQTLSAKGSSLRLGEDMIATTVCRHSIKANDKLSMPEIEALLRDLFACEMPYCCPHGRPTLIQMSLKELEKKFGRVGP